MTSAPAESPSRCRLRREGKTPPRSCHLCRLAGCEVRRELTGDGGDPPKPPENGSRVHLGRTPGGFITADLEELLEDVHGSGVAP